MGVRTHPIFNKLHGGELDPFLEGLVDIPAYGDTAKSIINLVCRSHGGLDGRGGFHFVAATKYSDKKARLIPFQYSALQNYMNEFGSQYIRFFMDCGQVMVGSGSNLVTNGTFDSDIASWVDLSTGTGSIAWDTDHMAISGGASGQGWAQQALTTTPGTVYMLQFDVLDQPVGVQVSADSGGGGHPFWWIGFVLGAVLGGGSILFPATPITPQTGYQLMFRATTTTTYIQFFKSASATGGIDNVICQTAVPYEISSPFLEADLPEIQSEESSEEQYIVHPDYHPRLLTRASHTNWSLTIPEFIDGPYEDELVFPTIAPSATAGAGITLTGVNQTTMVYVGTGLNNLTPGGVYTGTEHRKILVQISSLGTPDTFQYSYDAGVTWEATGIPITGAAQSIGHGMTVTFGTTTGHNGTENWYWEAHGLFQAGHVGSLWRLKHGTTWGYVKITAVTNAVTATADVKTTLGGTGASVAIREGAWSGVNGYPRTIAFAEGRMIYFGSPEHPDTFWGSKVGKPLVMTPGTLADDPFVFKISGNAKLIRWAVEGNSTMIGTVKGEVTLKGGTDTPLSALTPPKVSLETTHGSAPIQALRIDKAALFVQKSLRRIRELIYQADSDSFVSPDLCEKAEHLFRDADIVSWTYTQEPVPIIWVALSDGVLLGCTYNRYANTVGWHQHNTTGSFEDVGSVPYAGKDQLWAIVNRSIGGVTKRYVEYRDPEIHVDSALVYSGEATSTVYGLEHLIGETVQIVGDGMVRTEQVVPASAQLTLDPAASEIYIGKGYTCTLLTNRPEVAINGTSQGLPKRWNQVMVRVLETLGLCINDEDIDFPIGNMDEGNPAYSGDIMVPNLGWDADGRIKIEQKQPLPVHITCIMGTLAIGD